MLRLFVLGILTLFILACNSKEKKSAQGGIAISTADAVIAPGVYRTKEITQTSFRDYNAKERVYSELRLDGSTVIYISFRDGKEVNRKQGTYEPKKHAVLFVNEGSGEYDRDVVADVKPESFKMKHGRQMLEFQRVP